MTDVAVALQGSFSKEGFHLDASISGLGKELAKVDPVFADLDLQAITTAIEVLQTVDFAKLAETIQDGAEQADGLLGKLPDGDALLSDLTSLLGKIATAADPDIALMLKQLHRLATRLAERLRLEEAAAMEMDVAVAAGRLALVFDVLAKVATNPLLAAALVVFTRIAGKLVGGWTVLAKNIEGGVSLLASLESMGGLDALTRRLAELAQDLARLFDGGEIEALVKRLRALLATLDASDLLNIDFNDDAAITLVIERVTELAKLVEDLAERINGALNGGIAALDRIDLPGLVASMEAYRDRLIGAGDAGVREFAAAVRKVAEPLVARKLPDLGAGESGATYLSRAVVETAEKLAGVDPWEQAAPLAQGLKDLTGPLDKLTSTAEQVSAGIEKAIDEFATVAGSLNLDVAAHAVEEALKPAADALAAIRAEIEELQKAIDASAAKLKQLIAVVRGRIEDAFGEIRKAFLRLGEVVSQEELDKVVAELRAGVEKVADFLRAAPLQPFIDTTIGILNTAADLLSAVPKDLLPEAVRKELDAACEALKKLDFTAVAEVLAARLHEIIDDVEHGKVLEECEVIQTEVVTFLDSINPREPVERLEAETFDKLVEKINDLDPMALLEPVQKVLDDARDTLKRVDPGALLKPIEDVFDQVLAAFDELDPAKLLKGLAEGADALRKDLEEAIPIGNAVDAVTTFDAWVAKNLGAIDEAKLLKDLDAIYDEVARAVKEVASETGQLAGTLQSLLRGVSVDASLRSFGTSLTWIYDESRVKVLSERMELVLEAVAKPVKAVEALKLPDLLADLTRAHKAITAEANASPLREQLAPILAGCDPARLFGSLVDDIDRHAKATDTALARLGRFEGETFTQLTALAVKLRAALAPIDDVLDRLKVWLRWLGADLASDGLAKSLNKLLEVYRPSKLLPPLVHVVAVKGSDLAKHIHADLLAPVIAALEDVKRLIALIAVPVPPALTELHAKIVVQLEKLRPSVLLKDTLPEVQKTVDALVKLDPLKDAKDVIADAQRAAAALVAEAKPTVLCRPVFEIYDRIVKTFEDLDIAVLLQPVFDALGDLELQLDAGMVEAAEALNRLKDSIESPGGLSVGAKVVS